MKQKKISRSEWNKKVAISRWKKVEKRISLNIKIKEKELKYRKLKAKLLGFLAGDGGVYVRTDKNNTVHYDIAFYPDDKLMLKHFVDAFKEVYEKEPTIRNLGNYFKVSISSKPACLVLIKITNFGTLKWDVPFKYLTSKILKIEWLKAFFDCEAYVGSRQIQLQSVNKKGLSNVQKLLFEYGIYSKIYEYQRKNKNWNTNYILSMARKESIRKFYNEIGFNHAKKLEKLTNVVKASVPESG